MKPWLNTSMNIKMYEMDSYSVFCSVSSQGRENNFLKKSQSTISLLDTLYDYTSVMHYRASAFSNGNGNTILTSDPEFQDVIGKSTEMSSTDVLELNRLYCCGRNHILIDSN